MVDTIHVLEENSRSFVEGIEKLNDYANALHHPVITKGQQRGEPMPAYHGGKEDAYLVYAISTSIVNVLNKKFQIKVSERREAIKDGKDVV